MTLINGKEFKCPRCGDTFSTVIHDSINVSMLPHLKEEFLSGKLNQAVCPQCNTAYSVANAVLYHDMNNGVMIHVLLTEEYSNDRERAIKEFTGIMRENISSLGGTMRKNFERYKFDIVFSIDELRESLDSMAGVCSEKVKAITENVLRLEPDNITRERPHTIDSRFKLGIKKQEAICDKCGTSFESSPKQSFLGFLLFTCPKCAKKITHPLRTGYRILYWFLAIFLALALISAIGQGGIAIPGFLGIATLIALFKDRSLRKKLKSREVNN